MKIRRSILKKIISEVINEEIEYGAKFNHEGITWIVMKPGKTSSRAKAITKSAAGKTKVVDNKIIKKNQL